MQSEVCGRGRGRRVAESTPTLETTNGVRYVSPAFSHTTAVARPARTGSSWFMAKKAEPTMRAIDADLLNDRAAVTTVSACRHVDQANACVAMPCTAGAMR